MGKRYIKLYEQILNWEWFCDPNTLQLFLYLLLKANYKDSSFQGVDVKRGQIVTSLSKLGQATGQTIRMVRDNLKHLEMTGEVTSQSTNRYRIITIVRYDEYQTSDKQNDKQTTNETTSKTTSKTTSETATSIEYIESIKPKEIIKKTPSESTPPDGFDQFWSAYPRHTGKADAKKAFDKLKPDIDLLGKMLDAIEKQKASSQWLRDDGQYIPYPATWLNKKRWEDEVEQTTAPVRRQTGGTAPAQKYEQRDYASEQDAAVDRMMNSDWGSW